MNASPDLGPTHRQHIVTLVIIFTIFSLIVKLSEEVESYHSVYIYNNGEQQYSQHQLEKRQDRCSRIIDVFYILDVIPNHTKTRVFSYLFSIMSN